MGSTKSELIRRPEDIGLVTGDSPSETVKYFLLNKSKKISSIAYLTSNLRHFISINFIIAREKDSLSSKKISEWKNVSRTLLFYAINYKIINSQNVFVREKWS